jgi:hypothetical protein
MRGSVRKSKILLAIFVVLPAAVLLTAQGSRGEPAADECRANPGPAGPPGSHWFYHINRADGRHCWYLNDDGEKVHQPASRAETRAAPSDATLQRENNENLEIPQPQPPLAPSPMARPTQAPTPAPMTAAPTLAPRPMVSAPAAPAPALPPDLGIRRPAPIDFTMRWQNLPKPQDLKAREAATANNNSVDKTVADDNSVDQNTAADDAAASADADADHAARRQSSIGGTSSGSVLLAGVLIVASSLLFAGGVVRLLNRPRRRRAGGWLKARRPMRAYFGAARRRRAPQSGRSVTEVASGAAAVAFSAKEIVRNAAAAAQMPTDPADDLKGSLGELMGDLQRAGAASPSLQSFVPSAYQRPKRAPAPTSSPGDGPSEEKQVKPQVVEARPLSLEEELLRHFGGDVMLADNAG